MFRASIDGTCLVSGREVYSNMSFPQLHRWHQMHSALVHEASELMPVHFDLNTLSFAPAM